MYAIVLKDATSMRAKNTGRAIEDAAEPLVVRPRTAWWMLGCGNTHGYALLAAGELESFLDGSARKITVASIRAYVDRKLAAAESTCVAPSTELESHKFRSRKTAP
jgi:hypothetical protein